MIEKPHFVSFQPQVIFPMPALRKLYRPEDPHLSRAVFSLSMDDKNKVTQAISMETVARFKPEEVLF